MGDRRSLQPIVSARLAREISLTALVNKHFNDMGRDIEKQYIAHGENGLLAALVTAQQAMLDLLIASNSKTAGMTGVMQFNKLTTTKQHMHTKILESEISSGLTEFIASNALRSSLLIQDTDRRIAATIIAEAVEAEVAVSTVTTAARLRSAFTNISTNFRANTIARTEIGIAASEGQDQGARLTGLDLLKEWVAVSDDRTRDNHKEVDGQRVAMDGLFTVGSDRMLRPHDVVNGSAGNIINCRCVTDYVPVEIANL